MVQWPAVIKNDDDDELIYIHSQQQWDNDTELHDFDYDDSDKLIDSSGKMYTLTIKVKHWVQPRDSGAKITLHDLLGLVKAHAAQKGSCCVAKLYAPTFSDAFKIIESLEET